MMLVCFLLVVVCAVVSLFVFVGCCLFCLLVVVCLFLVSLFVMGLRHRVR